MRIARKAAAGGDGDVGMDGAIAPGKHTRTQELPAGMRTQFESSLGADLSSVRLHTGDESAQAASDLGARAFTTGNDIHFGAGQFQPDDPYGLHLIAHEVAHTQQPASASPRLKPEGDGAAGNPDEAAADKAADAMVAGTPGAHFVPFKQDGTWDAEQVLAALGDAPPAMRKAIKDGVRMTALFCIDLRSAVSVAGGDEAIFNTLSSRINELTYATSRSPMTYANLREVAGWAVQFGMTGEAEKTGAAPEERTAAGSDPIPHADWGALYGGKDADPMTQVGQKASVYKAKINQEGGEALKPASDPANTDGGKKKVNKSVFRLTRDEMFQILHAAHTEGGIKWMHGFGKEDTAEKNREKAKTELDKYIGYCQAAFETMMIDTVEAQALFLGHAAGETAFAELTEGQEDKNRFEDKPEDVKVSTSVAPELKDDGTPKKYTGTDVNVIAGPMRYGQPENPHFDSSIDANHAINGKDENSFDQTFIGRGPIQVTFREGYVQAIMFMEKRAEDLRAEAATATDAAVRAKLEKQAADLEEASNAIKTEPRNAANPKYAFLFSAAHMQASVMVERSAGGYSEGGMSGGAKDRKKSPKMAAYGKAVEILMKHKAEDEKAAAAAGGP